MFVPNQYFFLTSLWNVIRIFAVYGNLFFLESQIKYMYNKRILVLSFEEYR